MKSLSINQFLDKHNIQNKIVKKMMEETIKYEKEQAKEKKPKRKIINGISERLLRMIRKKEEILKQ